MDKKWHFTSADGSREEVALEPWVWGALYEDGTELHQFGEDGVFHRIGEVEQERVKMFVLYQPEGKGRIDLVVPKGAKLIHKYKRFVFNAATPFESRKTAHCIGIKVDGTTFFTYVLPDNRIVQSVNEEPNLSEFGVAA